MLKHILHCKRGGWGSIAPFTYIEWTTILTNVTSRGCRRVPLESAVVEEIGSLRGEREVTM